MRRVEQQEGNGCAIAVLAMLTGRTYEQVRADFVDIPVSDFAMQMWLAEHGWATAMKYPHYMPQKRDRDVWPPAPFAGLHFVTVSIPAGFHSVVMLGSGRVIDPAPSREGRYTLADYEKVMHVGGVVKLRPTSSKMVITMLPVPRLPIWD